MKRITVAAVGAFGIVLAAGMLSASGQTQYQTQHQVQNQTQRNINIGGIEKIDRISAGPDGSAWALTTSGRVLYCKGATGASDRVTCYDSKGETDVSY